MEEKRTVAVLSKDAAQQKEPARRSAGGRWTEVIGWAALVGMVAALYAIFIYVPTERVMGIVQRIFYVHVSIAWVAYLAFFVVFVSSIVFLWRRDQRWDRLARSSAEVGVVFTSLVLITGPIWGKPIWGVWWSWDARLTSTLVLWFIYVGYLMLRAYTSDNPNGPRYAAVLGIVGFVDVPIVHLSVTWWRTLHPEPTVLRADPALPPSMLFTLFVALIAITLLYVYLLLQKLSVERLKDDLREFRQQVAAGPLER